MGKFIVVRSRIDTAFKEHNDTIWQGEAENEEDAITKAVEANYEPKDRSFMKHYCSAYPLLN